MEKRPSLRHPVFERLSSRELAVKVCVASVAAVALAHLGPVAAFGGVVASLAVESAVERAVARLRKRTLWGVALLAILLDHAERAFAAIGLRSSRRPARGAATLAAVTAGTLVVAGFTLPEVALGHSLVSDRPLTFFAQRHDAGAHKVVVGPAATLTLPLEVRGNATSPSGAHLVYEASTSAGRLRCAPVSGALFPVGATTVHCAALAGARVSRGSFPVIVVDGSPPRLELPHDVVWPTSRDTGAIVTFRADAYDAVAGAVAVHCTPTSGSLFALGRTTVTCRAADRAGNVVSDSFAVDVRHVTGETLVLPAPMRVEATSAHGAVVAYTVAHGVSCSPVSSSRLEIGPHTISCRLGSEGRAFRVSVVDTTPPRLQLPRDRSAAADSKRGARVAYTASALDTVDGRVTVACKPRSGALFAIGRTAVMCAASDAHGNRRSSSFTVTVRDGAPTLHLPATLSAKAVNAHGAPVALRFSAVDVVDGRISASCAPALRTFPIGRTPVTCSARDTAGHLVSGSITVVVRDEDAPILRLPKSPLVVTSSGRRGAAATWTVSASDNVDGVVPVRCDATSGNVFPPRDTTVKCTARDRAGNVSTGAFVVSVRDAAAPAVTVPSRVDANAVDARGTKVRFTASAVDAVDGPVAVTCDHLSGSQFPLGDTTVSCTAKDSSGNVSAPAVFVVSVRDRTPPRLQLPASPVDASASGAAGAKVSFAADAVDNVDGTITARCDHKSGDLFPLGRTLVTCSASDAAGNAAAPGSFVVVVVDRDPPVIVWPPNPYPVESGWPSGTKVSWRISATDNVDGRVAVSCDHTNGAVFPVGDTTVSCWATDAARNTARGSFVVHVHYQPPG